MIICGVATSVSNGAAAHFNFKSLFDRDISIKPQEIKKTWPLIAVPFADVLMIVCYVLNYLCVPDTDMLFNTVFFCFAVGTLAGIFFVNLMAYNIFAEDSTTSESCLIFLKPYAPVKRGRDPVHFDQI